MMKTQIFNRHTGRGAILGSLLALATVVTGCDFLDPTEVENPRTTAEDLQAAENPTAALLPGLRAQRARMIATTGVVPEVVSDNFSIHGTGLVKAWDTPATISPSVINSTGTATGMYWNAQELKALATFVIEDIAPNDETADAADIAEAYFHRGMAYLILGENFSAAPVEEDGEPLAADQLLDLAIADLGEAGAFGTAVDAALARAHRLKGNASAASAAANSVLADDPEFLLLQEYDASSISNTPFFFLVLRALQEMQPLPRLDFLDPKYLTRTQGIAVAKAEEMHLILAEIALTEGNVGDAQSALRAAIELAQSRSVTNFDDDDPRLNADLSIRPRDETIQIRADASSPFRSGLVLTRPGVVSAPIISGTSLDADSVAALTDEDELWHAFHLARQEILFLEGRRMSDLGIRLPMMQREIDANPNIERGDAGTQVVVPAYLPPQDQIDLFTPASPYDADGFLVTTEITINHDVNAILAANRVSPFN